MKSNFVSRSSTRNLLEYPAVTFLLFLTATRAVVTQDVVFGDEIGYLSSGLSLDPSNVPGFPSSPAYALTYSLLGRLTADPIGLYFAMRVAAAVVFVGSIWVAARASGNPIAAWLVTATAVALPITYAWPGVSAFAAAFVLMGMALFLMAPSPVRLSITSLFFWLAAAFRPEFAWLALAVSLLSAGWVLFSFRETRHCSKRSTVWKLSGLFLAVGVPLTMFSWFGSPFSGSRSWVAFGQHYSLRRALPNEDPWLEWTTIVSRDFGASESIGDAVQANASMTVTHVLGNIRDLPTSFVSSGLIDASAPSVGRAIGGLMALVIVAGLGWSRLEKYVGRIVRSGQVGSTQRFESSPPKRLWTILVVSMTVIASVLSVFLIYPRQHYLQLPSGLLLVGLAWTWSQIDMSNASSSIVFATASILLLLMLAQTLQMSINRASYPAPIAKSLSLMRSTPVDWKVLTSNWGLRTGLGVFVPEAEIYDPQEVAFPMEVSPDSMRNRSDFNAYWLDTEMVESLQLQDSEWSMFFDAPERYGFRRIHPESQLFVSVGGDVGGVSAH